MLKNLDFLRALAVLLVLGSHIGEAYHNYPTYAVIGHLGVLLFFVHTSYVLMMSLERLAKKHKRFRDLLAVFYTRRAFRIYPLVMFCVTLTTILGYPYIAPLAAEIKGTFLSNFFLIQNITGAPTSYPGLWTLPVELQLYLLLPFCYWLVRKNVLFVIPLAALSVWVGVWASTIKAAFILPFLPLVYFPCFVCGIIAYGITTNLEKIKQIEGKYWIPALLSLLVACGFIFRPTGESGLFANDWITALSIALLIPIFKDMGTSWMSKASFQVAKFSYGIYLLHIPILVLTNNNVIATLVLTGLASIAAYYVIEAPFIRLGQRLTTVDSLA